jgi:hypothetical protein
MKALSPIWNEKPETASRIRGRIEAVLDWARTSTYRQGENPARWKGALRETSSLAESYPPSLPPPLNSKSSVARRCPMSWAFPNGANSGWNSPNRGVSCPNGPAPGHLDGGGGQGGADPVLPQHRGGRARVPQGGPADRGRVLTPVNGDSTVVPDRCPFPPPSTPGTGGWRARSNSPARRPPRARTRAPKCAWPQPRRTRAASGRSSGTCSVPSATTRVRMCAKAR